MSCENKIGKTTKVEFTEWNSLFCESVNGIQDKVPEG